MNFISFLKFWDCRKNSKKDLLYFDFLEYIMKEGEILNDVNVKDFFIERGVLTENITAYETRVTNRGYLNSFLLDLSTLKLIKITANNIDTSYIPDRFQQLSDIRIIAKILPMGVEYVLEQRKANNDKFIKSFTITLLIITSLFSLITLVLKFIEFYCQN